MVSTELGTIVGAIEGFSEGTPVELGTVGPIVVGTAVGSLLGLQDGAIDGKQVGDNVGTITVGE